ncbi:hypothetical protein DND132_1771 [Pseudodesulfovibrio mercurii]|uniref:Nif11 domain-containing protein n=1 Tax=Pseudodesulfovibrio mercurii TaxID=641491 RepID=F0JFY1_9BACT|nr:hypothetical protein [Pseudodesulfovibrio mercurii]EGB14977.1 hypothetical protein DND132_1771 [Pseudodesulfovibrio mercurii]
MSRDELSRLLGDALADPDMIRKAMTLTDRPAMETYIRERGYALAPEEMDEVWTLARDVMGSEAGPMSAARWRLTTMGGEHSAPTD